VSEVRQRSQEDIVIALVGNKIDRDDLREVQAGDVEAYAKSEGILHFLASAKTGERPRTRSVGSFSPPSPCSPCFALERAAERHRKWDIGTDSLVVGDGVDGIFETIAEMVPEQMAMSNDSGEAESLRTAQRSSGCGC